MLTSFMMCPELPLSRATGACRIFPDIARIFEVLFFGNPSIMVHLATTYRGTALLLKSQSSTVARPQIVSAWKWEPQVINSDLSCSTGTADLTAVEFVARLLQSQVRVCSTMNRFLQMDLVWHCASADLLGEILLLVYHRCATWSELALFHCQHFIFYFPPWVFNCGFLRMVTVCRVLGNCLMTRTV